MKRVFVVLLALLLPVCGFAASARAAFPEKEIRIIVPYKAGGQSDLTARKLADIIQSKKLLPQPVIVVNIAGGNTTEGIKAALEAKPDGYTLFLHHTAILTMNALGLIKTSWKDFDMVGQCLYMPMMLMVNADSPWKNASDMIAAAKKEPGKFTCAMPGTGGTAHMAALQFFAKTGLMQAVRQVPLDGANEAITAQMGRRVDMRASTSVDTARFIKSGEQRAILLMNTKPLPGQEGVQMETDFGITTPILLRNGLFAPKGLDKAAQKILVDAVKAAVDSPEFQEFGKAQTAMAVFEGPEQWSKSYAQDEKAIKEVAQSMKAKK